MTVKYVLSEGDDVPYLITGGVKACWTERLNEATLFETTDDVMAAARRYNVELFKIEEVYVNIQ